MTRTSFVTVVLACAALAVLAISGCATPTGGARGAAATPSPAPVREPTEAPVQPPIEFEPPSRLPVLGTPGDVSEPVPGGEVDWTGNTVRARGTGVIDPGAKNLAQARLMAERAAVVVAQRNLLEIIKGVRVDSETRVENFMTDYDVVYTRVEGKVKGARQRGPTKHDEVAGLVSVELEIDLYGQEGVSDALLPVLGSEDVMMASTATPQVRDFLAQYSALAFDGGDAGLKPAMYPKIYDAGGNLLLDTRDYAQYIGQGGRSAMQFVSDLDRVLSRSDLQGIPLVLKVKQVSGTLEADIILGRQDADKLKWLKDGFKFLVGAGRFVLKVLL